MESRYIPSVEAAHAQLERVLTAPAFANSIRSQRFLRYVVEHSLREEDEPLKEYAIAVEAFDRDASYDPSIDATVRMSKRDACALVCANTMRVPGKTIRL